MSIALPASMGLTDILSLAIAAILVNNYILVQFLGCCSFFGVSKKTDTALGMGMAVIFVMRSLPQHPGLYSTSFSNPWVWVICRPSRSFS